MAYNYQIIITLDKIFENINILSRENESIKSGTSGHLNSCINEAS